MVSLSLTFSDHNSSWSKCYSMFGCSVRSTVGTHDRIDTYIQMCRVSTQGPTLTAESGHLSALYLHWHPYSVRQCPLIFMIINRRCRESPWSGVINILLTTSSSITRGYTYINIPLYMLCFLTWPLDCALRRNVSKRWVVVPAAFWEGGWRTVRSCYDPHTRLTSLVSVDMTKSTAQSVQNGHA
jgi:hypothetical protein